MNSKLVGAILIITGTCIGAGMLALPVATAQNDLISTTLLMILTWFVMTMGALYILETNLQFRAGVNMVSMARETLGPIGALFAWITTLLLLYALLSAYITGGTQITQYWLTLLHLPSGLKFSTLLFTGIMGTIVLAGVRTVDYSNRGLMTIKSLALILLIMAISTHMHWSFARFGKPTAILHAMTVVITSFGYASIIPSLRIYLKDDVASLKKAIIIGSLIPLIIYILWNCAVHSALPNTGPLSLSAMQQSGNASSQLALALITATHSASIKVFANLFTSICVFTSFLGVALALSDFLADGIHQEKNNIPNITVNALLTFSLPVLVAIFFPKAFIIALSYAGILCVLLLIILPVLMVLSVRSKTFTPAINLSQQPVFGGKLLLYFALVIGLIALALSIVFF